MILVKFGFLGEGVIYILYLFLNLTKSQKSTNLREHWFPLSRSGVHLKEDILKSLKHIAMGKIYEYNTILITMIVTPDLLYTWKHVSLQIWPKAGDTISVKFLGWNQHCSRLGYLKS